jgi:hypothetical protein
MFIYFVRWIEISWIINPEKVNPTDKNMLTKMNDGDVSRIVTRHYNQPLIVNL